VPRDRNIPQTAFENQPLVEAIARMVNEEVDRRVGADAAFETRQRARMVVMADGMWGAEHQDLVRLTEDAPSINIEGRPFRRLTQLSSKVYLGLWGTHSIAEPLYRDASVRAGPTVKPLDLRVGVIAGSLLPDAARVLGYLMAEGTSRQAVKTLSTMGMRPPSRAYIEDRVHRLASELVEHRDALHAVARDAEAMQELPVAAVSAGLDRFAVRMSELLPEDKAPPPRERRKPYKRRPPPPRELNWRMAWVGSVTLYDADGDPLRTIRVSSDAATPRTCVVAQIVAEVAAILERHPGIPVVCIQDGAKELRVLPDRLRTLCAANSPFYPCVDFYHATSYLDAVVQACEPEGDPHNMRLWYRQRLLNDKRASYSLVAGLQRRLAALDEHGDKDAFEATKRALTYLKPRRKLMRYAHLRALHLPIGSGATESTCALMQARVKQPGMSWRRRACAASYPSVNSSSPTAGSSPGPLSRRTTLPGSRLLDQDRIRAPRAGERARLRPCSLRQPRAHFSAPPRAVELDCTPYVGRVIVDARPPMLGSSRAERGWVGLSSLSLTEPLGLDNMGSTNLKRPRSRRGLGRSRASRDARCR